MRICINTKLNVKDIYLCIYNNNNNRRIFFLILLSDTVKCNKVLQKKLMFVYYNIFDSAAICRIEIITISFTIYFFNDKHGLNEN